MLPGKGAQGGRRLAACARTGHLAIDICFGRDRQLLFIGEPNFFFLGLEFRPSALGLDPFFPFIDELDVHCEYRRSSAETDSFGDAISGLTT